MILESGELDSGGELLGERPGDGWTFLRMGDAAPKLTIRYGGKSKRADVTYELHTFDAIGGVGVRLVKLSPGTDPDDPSHDVILAETKDPPVCTCRGFSRWSHCKHGAALLAIRERGLLDARDDGDEVKLAEVRLAEVRPPAPVPPALKPTRLSEIDVPF